MGSPKTPTAEACRDSDEDVHVVTLTHAFEIQATETTQGQFLSLMGRNPSGFSSCGPTCPVESVTWHEAAAYCNALSQHAGKPLCYTCSGSGSAVTCKETSPYDTSGIYACSGYRLPTEAEWEYAYRATTTTPFYNGPNDAKRCRGCTTLDTNADAIAWYCTNTSATTHPVGQKLANAWKLFDMAGNVWEWCNDRFDAALGTASATNPWGPSDAVTYPNRAGRGGAWYDTASFLRAATRGGYVPSTQITALGFRCARTR